MPSSHGDAAAVFVLRRRARPAAPLPTWGYPVVPALFILACLLLLVNTLVESPRESVAGLNRAGVAGVLLVPEEGQRIESPRPSAGGSVVQVPETNHLEEFA